jgi:hypothetical protein
MEKELIDYIITYYSRFLSIKESTIQRHHLATVTSENADSPRLKEMIIRQWGTKDSETLKLLDNGYEEFKRVTAEKIIKNHKEEVIINNCPKCSRLARTPFAKQCRHCGFNWR